MKDITTAFEEVYTPFKALVIYRTPQQEPQLYVEAYDVDNTGMLTNAHPLMALESIALAGALDCSEELKRTYLRSIGLLPERVLYINPENNGYAIWHTPAMETNMLFTNSLKIPDGKVWVPAILWKATKQSLYVYALAGNRKPDENTPLYKAPFFNIHEDGKVCLGTVEQQAHQADNLEAFMTAWESAFWNSRFSHTITKGRVKGNIIQLWQEQVDTGRPFPGERLIKNKKTLKNIL